MPHFGTGDARLFTMRSRDLINWSALELLRVKGPDVTEKAMGRMIDPYLLADQDEPGKWWCFYKQNGVSMSSSTDLKTWRDWGGLITWGRPTDPGQKDELRRVQCLI